MSGMNITLKYPVEVNGVQIKEIRLRRPKVRDLEVMDKAKGGDIAKSVTLVANLSDLDPETVRDMDTEDFNEVAEAVGSFLGVAVPTSGS